MTVSTSQYRMVDRLTGGTLAEMLVTARERGSSWEEIARGLAVDYGAEVSWNTLRVWHTKIVEAGDAA